MTSMIERVARVLEPQAWAALEATDTLAYKNRRTSSIRKARATIEAMREPNDRMLTATEEVAVGYDDFATGDGTLFLSHPGFHDNAKTAWCVMVDASLETTP